jgi:hypothetical protein
MRIIAEGWGLGALPLPLHLPPLPRPHSCLWGPDRSVPLSMPFA